MAAECLPPDSVCLPVMRRDGDEPHDLVTSVARLHAAGGTVDWEAFHSPHHARSTDLPTYAFRRTRLWLEAAAGGTGDADGLGQQTTGHPLLTAATELPDTQGAVLTGRLSLSSHPWLGDHAVHGTVLLPGTAFVEMALRAAHRRTATPSGNSPCTPPHPARTRLRGRTGRRRRGTRRTP